MSSAKLFIFRQHVGQSGRVCEQMSEGDGAEGAATEIGAKAAEMFVEPEQAPGGLQDSKQ